MATPACSSTCLLEKLVISWARSRSTRVLRAASAFSTDTLRLAKAKSSRFWAAPTSERNSFRVSIALLMASRADAALASVSSVTPVRPSDVVLMPSSVKLSESSLSVPVPILKVSSRLEEPVKELSAAATAAVALKAVLSAMVNEPGAVP